MQWRHTKSGKHLRPCWRHCISKAYRAHCPCMSRKAWKQFDLWLMVTPPRPYRPLPKEPDDDSGVVI